MLGCEAMHTSKILLLVARPISGLITLRGDKKGKLWQELVIDGKKVAGGSIRKNFLEDLDL